MTKDNSQPPQDIETPPFEPRTDAGGRLPSPEHVSKWRALAQQMLALLNTERTRDWGFTRRDRFVFPPMADPAPAGVPGFTFGGQGEMLGQLWSASPGRSDYRPRPAPLLAVLRLACTFGTDTALWSTLCAPGTVLLISTGTPELNDVLRDLLEHLIESHASWEMRQEPQVFDVEAAMAVSETPGHNGPLLAKLSPKLHQTLVTGAPIILIGASAEGLPAALRALGPRDIPLAPVTPEIVFEHLRVSYGRGCCDLADAVDGIPPEMTKRMTLDNLVLALRAPCGADAVRILAQNTPKTKPDGPGLMDFPLPMTVREPLDQLITDLAAWQAGRLHWRDLSRGMLLWGPPGTGKTEIARLLAREASIAVHAGSVARWQSSGSRGSNMVREMQAFFEKALADAPCIIFIDELDALGDRARTPDHNSAWTDNIVTAFLECLDGFEELEGVVVIAATNHPHKLDAAIRRPGRFDKLIQLGHPCPDLLPEVLRWHLWPDLKDVDVSRISARLIGMSGAEIAGLVRDARARARRAARPLGLPDLESALAAQRSPSTPEKQWQIAVHEAGHAVLAAATGRFKPKMLALVANGGIIDQERCHNHGQCRDIEAELMCMLGGRAAETLVLGEPSQGSGGGCASDLALATELAAALEVSYGLGDCGPVWLASPDDAISRLRIDPQMRQRVRLHLERAESRAIRLLKHNRDLLEDLAASLVANGMLKGKELDIFLSRANAPSGQQCLPAAQVGNELRNVPQQSG